LRDQGTKNLTNDWLLGKLWVPSRARIEGDELIWEADLISPPDSKARRRPTLTAKPVPLRMLDAFINLVSEKQCRDGMVVRELNRNRVCGFATTCGVFRISPLAIGEGTPHAEAAGDDNEATAAVARVLRQENIEDGHLAILDARKRVRWEEIDYPTAIVGREPLAHWEGFARQARAVLRIAAKLGQRSSHEDWHDAMCLGTGNLPPDAPFIEARTASPRLDRPGSLIPDDWFFVQRIINDWLADSGVRPIFTWDAPNGIPPKLELTSGNGTLYGALAVQLAVKLDTQLKVAISRSASYVTCTACGDFYKPGRLPHAVDSPYCKKADCQKARKRNGQRKRRA